MNKWQYFCIFVTSYFFILKTIVLLSCSGFQPEVGIETMISASRAIFFSLVSLKTKEA
jgi:hypothetical protein